MQARWLALVLLCAGCGSRMEIDLTIDFSGVDPSKVTALELTVEGDRAPFARTLPIDGQLGAGEGRLVYLPGQPGTLKMGVVASGAMGELGRGETDGVLARAGHATAATVTVTGQGSGGDLGAPDLASSDLSVGDLADLALADLGPPLDLANDDALAGLLLFDDFESGMIDSSRWNTYGTGANLTATVDGTTGADGTAHSLHFHAATTSQMTVNVGVGNTTLATPIATLYLRFWAKLSGTFPATNGDLVYYGDTGTGDYVAIGLDSASGHHFQLAGNGVSNYGTTSLTPSWACYEWMVKNSPSPTSQELLGAAASVLVSPLVFPTMTHSGEVDFLLGVSNAPAGTTLDLWFDEIAMSAQPLPCP